MENDIYNAALAFSKLMTYEYKFVVAAKKKSTEIILQFDEYSFHHLCGIHKLNDIIAPNISRKYFFKQILNQEIGDDVLNKSKNYIAEGVKDRIKCVLELQTYLNDLKQVYKFNLNANPISKLRGDYIFKWENSNHQNVYFIIQKDRYHREQYFGLSIFSRDKNKPDFALGHGTQGILYISRTPLTEENKPITEKEEILYQRPTYTNPNNNVKIVKFDKIEPNSADDHLVLASFRPTFGQAISSLFQRLNRFFDDISTRNKRQITELNNKLSEYEKEISKQSEMLNEKDKEISSLKKESSELSNQLKKSQLLFFKYKQLTKGFTQGINTIPQKNTQQKQQPQSQQKDIIQKPKHRR